jgi:hypothetical protein
MIGDSLMGVGTRTVIPFLAGDVMSGRGIDQILPRAGEPRLFKPCAGSGRLLEFSLAPMRLR